MGAKNDAHPISECASRRHFVVRFANSVANQVLSQLSYRPELPTSSKLNRFRLHQYLSSPRPHAAL